MFVPYEEEKPSDFTLHFWSFFDWRYELLERWADGSAWRGSGGSGAH